MFLQVEYLAHNQSFVKWMARISSRRRLFDPDVDGESVFGCMQQALMSSPLRLTDRSSM